MAARWVMTEPFLLCAACGDRIGMYEPLWCELPGGALGSSSYLNLSCEQRRGRSRLWHLGCLAPDAVAPELESLGPGRVGGPLGDRWRQSIAARRRSPIAATGRLTDVSANGSSRLDFGVCEF